MLQAEALDLLGRRADEGNALLSATAGEIGVLAEEAIAGKDGLGAGFLGGGQHLVLVKIGERCRAFAQEHRLIGAGNMQAVLVGRRVQSHALQAHLRDGALCAHGDGAAVGYEDLGEHGCYSASQMIMRTGVGLYALQGLFSCGQLLTSTSTLASAFISTYLPGALTPSSNL